MEKTGIYVPHDRYLDICEKVGANVDRVKQIVRIPISVMGDMIQELRKTKQSGEDDSIPKKLRGNISTQIYLIDYKTKTRRLGTIDDIMKGISLVQKLDNIPTCNAAVIPSDVEEGMGEIISFEKIYSYSRKPGGTYILTPFSAKYIIEMAKTMEREVAYLLESVSPLQFMKESLEMALIFGDAGKSLSIAPMVMAGSTGPVTAAGTIALQNAEVLASTFLIYILTKKFPRYVSGTHSSDLKTMICSFGSPNQSLYGICIAQMAKFYGMESVCNSGLTDALLPDFQTGFEKASSAILGYLAGLSDMGCQGIVGADQGLSFEQLVIDNEWLDACNYILEGVEVNDETLALDLINSVGVGGNYLAEEHTVEYMRSNYWDSKLFNRDAWNNWITNKSPDMLDKAYDYVQSVTANYKSMEPVISASKFQELEYIVKMAEKEMNNKYNNRIN